MLTRPQRHFHHHTVSRTIHQLRAEHLAVIDNFRRNTLLVSLSSLLCNERGHLEQIYDIFKTWLLRIWELFIRLKHHLSCSKCCFVGNKWFCCSFSNELLLIHTSNEQFACIYVLIKALIKGNEARVTTHNQVSPQVVVPSLGWSNRYGCKWPRMHACTGLHRNLSSEKEHIAHTITDFRAVHYTSDFYSAWK